MTTMFRSLTLVITFLAAAWVPAAAQTLFHYGPHAVTKDEFLRVYQKNSLGKEPDMSREALEEYLNLYALFRMKVQVAEERRMDTISTIQAELDNYRRQLAKNHLADNKVAEALTKEAYERMGEEIRVRHILILAAPTAPPADTLRAYQRIDSIDQLLQKKKVDFASLAESLSDDRASGQRGGDIGYITALQTIYAFENQAYQTPKGKRSKPFRSPFGYHILEVTDRRPTHGTLEVAQILVEVRKSEGEAGKTRAKHRADSLYTALKKGASFTDLVAQFSDDRFSKENEGKVPPFKVGAMVPAFEEAAFALKKIGDISRPVETEYGYHIIKLLNKEPLPSYDSIKETLAKQVASDGRYQAARDAFYQKVKAQNQFKEYPENLEPVIDRVRQIPDTGAMAHVLELDDFRSLQAPLFEFNGTPYSQYDFVTYAHTVTRGRILGPRQGAIQDLYGMYLQSVIQDLEELRLVRENPQIRQLMQEYRDGILLFELMDQEVWSKASRDSLGLQAFYETQKGKYMWEPGFQGSLYRFKNDSVSKEGMALLKKGKLSDEEIMEALNTSSMPDAVSIQRGRYEFSRFKEFEASQIKAKAVLGPKKGEDGSQIVLKVKEVFTKPAPKTLEEARGFVVAQYQDKLERDWNESLRARFPLKVNEEVFRSMVN